MDKILVLKEITHAFDQKPIFENLNMAVAKNDVVSIVGASGVGKTTLFNIAAGLLMPTSGQVWIKGVETTGQAGTVGYMLQKDLLLPFKSVFDNIALPLTLKGYSKAKIEEIVRPQLPHFGLQGLEQQYPQTLSGGQRQRAALLRTYLSDNPIMLLDEPFSALDFVTKDEMYHWFSQLQKRLELTCLIITHDIDEAIYLSNHLYVLKGSPAQFTEQFEIPKDEGFMESRQYLILKKQILKAIQE
ncbi:ABC transporter ATP-binding protein [Psychrobacter phenylpyruvicus]|uniref:Aliphatic sulfonates import ATP-binding protein SsuB n=1 Tax=Psychrobacter phenylpyruvicus TaxID=29432 RepID=A0A379LM80_9GAMM|nr:ABC transporter ATP-binding protein [Psychrobacter phenylpyruvicus]SUD90987.1 Aliphatic sulfonates import ATP-binding protein SsuB [Psychrobacter phenylpyruvicus]